MGKLGKDDNLSVAGCELVIELLNISIILNLQICTNIFIDPCSTKSYIFVLEVLKTYIITLVPADFYRFYFLVQE